MNPAQGQGQPQQQAQAGGGQQPPLFQPAQIRQLTILSEEEKTKYAAGLEGLWAKVKSSNKDSQEYKQASEKIMNFSQMLHNKIQQRQASMLKHRQQMQQQQQQQMQQTQAAQAQQQPQGNTQQQAQQQPQQPQAPQPSQPQAAAQNQAQGQQQAGANMSAAGQAATGAGAAAGQPQQQGANQANKLPENIMNHLRSITFKVPPEMKDKPQTEVNKFLQETRTKYGRALMSIESAKTKIKAIDRQVAIKQNQGNPFSEEDMKKISENKTAQLKIFNDASKWLENFRKQHVEMPSGQNGPQGAAKPGQVNTPQNGGQANAGNANIANQQQQAAGVNRASPANGASANPQAANRPNQAMQGQAQGQKAEQAPPTPVNAAAAANQAQNAGRVPTPGSSTPVSAAPAGPGRALSHSAAMSLANQRAASSGSVPTQASQQQQQQQQQQQAAGTPTSAGGPMQQNTAAQAAQPAPQQQPQQQVPQPQQPQQQQQGHPHAHPSQTQAGMHAKMPIPKQLPEKATAVPQGVALGGGVKGNRPTINQGTGTMGAALHQPTIPKIPAYNNEAEGDHVLSKKKLDELVRQVCGGSSEGQEGNLLTPDVEESVLNMADSFVDNVLHAACRNSKERGSKVLEIRDIQLVLERTYNIRVPGYSSDELRTVRKVQPSPGWIAKMSAVQAAKVMPGKGE